MSTATPDDWIINPPIWHRRLRWDEVTELFPEAEVAWDIKVTREGIEGTEPYLSIVWYFDHVPCEGSRASWCDICSFEDLRAMNVMLLTVGLGGDGDRSKYTWDPVTKIWHYTGGMT